MGKAKGAFLSSTKRFSKPSDISVKNADQDNPGPGEYTVKSSLAPGGVFANKEKRFKNAKEDEVPGPGSYDLSPLIKHSVLKGTFNSTLSNPAALMYEDLQSGNKANHVFALSA